jgi:hypothetical protein
MKDERQITMQRFMIIAGTGLVVIGLAWPWLAKLPFGRLPGDLNIVREGYSVHFPFTTSLLISIAITILLWLFRR